MIEWIRQSNLIEDVDDPAEDKRSERAWKWFIKQPLTIKSILGLHKRIMRLKLGPEAGQFRRCNVSVGGRTCPHYMNVAPLTHEWLENYGTFKRSLYYDCEHWAKSAHVEFEKIHPFVDGNGRTGRMILNWMRVKAGLEPLCIWADQRSDYYAWFK